MVLDRHAVDRDRLAADRFPPCEARLGSQVARRSAYDPVDLLVGPGPHQPRRLEWPLFSTFIDNIEMSLAKTDERIAKMYLALGDRPDLSKKVLDEMELTRKWVLKIVGDEWPLQHRHVLGQAIRIRSPYVDALSVTQVLALRSLRKKVDKEELSESQQAGFIYLILCTVSGVAAGLQNTG